MGSWQFSQTHSANISATNENRGKTFILESWWDNQGHCENTYLNDYVNVSLSVPSCLFYSGIISPVIVTVVRNHRPS